MLFLTVMLYSCEYTYIGLQWTNKFTRYFGNLVSVLC